MSKQPIVVLTKEELAIQKLRQKSIMERKKKYQEAKKKTQLEDCHPNER
jgi:hypothetical protein